MPIPLVCPGCQARLSVPDTAAGKKGRCPGCATMIPVPAAAPLITEFLDEPAPAPILDALPPEAVVKPRRKLLRRLAVAALGLLALVVLHSWVTRPASRNTPTSNKSGQPYPGSTLVKASSSPSTYTPSTSSGGTTSSTPQPTYTPPAPVYTPPAPVYTPPAPVVDTRAARRAYLRQEIARLQSALAEDRALLQRQQVAGPGFRIGTAFLNALINNSKNPNDQKMAPYVTPVIGQGGTELGNAVDRARAVTEARISSNQSLLNQYQAELNSLGW